MTEVVSRQIARASEPERSDDQAFTKRLIGYTADYLRSGEACDACDKIRVYRGIGSGNQPVLRADSDPVASQALSDRIAPQPSAVPKSAPHAATRA